MSMDYREYILDHYRNPRNYGKLDHPDTHAEDSNPLCGDQLAIDLQIEGDQVTAVRFQGRGCAISPRARCRRGGGNGSPALVCAVAKSALSRSPGNW